MINRFHALLDDNETVKLLFLLFAVAGLGAVAISFWPTHPYVAMAGALWLAFWCFTRIRYLSLGRSRKEPVGADARKEGDH